jgi:hypothetical protein
MVAAAITRLRASGFTVAADGDRLKVTGPALTDEQRAWLAKHKAEILVALDAEDEFEERAAIIHEGHAVAVDHDPASPFFGKPLDEPIFTITVEEAEAMARADVAGHPIVAAALREFPGATIAAIRRLNDVHDRLNDPHNSDAWE